MHVYNIIFLSLYLNPITSHLSYCGDSEPSVVCGLSDHHRSPQRCCWRRDRDSEPGLLPWEHGWIHQRSSYRRAVGHSVRRTTSRHLGLTSDPGRGTAWGGGRGGRGKGWSAVPYCREKNLEVMETGKRGKEWSSGWINQSELLSCRQRDQKSEGGSGILIKEEVFNV